MDSERRPRLTPAIADVRRAVREALRGRSSSEPARWSSSESRSDVPPARWSSSESRSDPRIEADVRATGVSIRPAGYSTSGNGGPAGYSTSEVVLVALSGGPDSLALAAATAFEAPRAGIRAGAVIINHGLQDGSADVAAAAAAQAESLGLSPVLVKRVVVGSAGGPEAAARDARYAALAEAAEEASASAVLLGHTLDDQAETVLLGLARGSGASSLSGMAPSSASGSAGAPGTVGASGTVGALGSGLSYLRPLLGIRRSMTMQFCADSGLTPWHDPQNDDERFSRVRVRNTILPLLERELGPGVAEALARTAAQLREDGAALDHFAEEIAEELADIAEAGISLPVRALASNPPALRQRLIRLAVESEFHVSLSRAQTLEVARLVTDWHGQKPLDLPGVRVERQGGLLIFSANG